MRLWVQAGAEKLKGGLSTALVPSLAGLAACVCGGRCGVLRADSFISIYQGSFISIYGKLWLTEHTVSLWITGDDSKHDREVW